MAPLGVLSPKDRNIFAQVYQIRSSVTLLCWAQRLSVAESQNNFPSLPQEERKIMFRVMMVASLLLTAVLPGASSAGSCNGSQAEGCFSLWASEHEIDGIVLGHGLTIEGRNPQSPDIALVSGPDGVPTGQLLNAVQQDPRVLGFESLERLALEESRLDSMADGSGVVIGALVLQGEYDGAHAANFAAPVWDGYMSQPAAELIRLPETRSIGTSEAQGFGTVAIIDTGVDPDHPVLQGALVPGYDFIQNDAGSGSEWRALPPGNRGDLKRSLEDSADQSFASILEGQGKPAHMGPSTRAIADQSFASILESADLPDAFGHGTMVAGLVRLAAPAAKIMPLRVFDGQGQANPWHVIQAIYFAVDHGANVINMSFSVDKQSVALKRAVQYAESHGVVCVSSAGNNGGTSKSWPAAFQEVLGVASTDLSGQLSMFSNHGPNLVSLAAPGEELITIYPGGLYAVAWGTSFSAGLVSGATTLLNSDETVMDLFVDFEAAEEVFEASSVEITSSQQAGSGRLDAYSAFSYGLSGH